MNRIFFVLLFVAILLGGCKPNTGEVYHTADGAVKGYDVVAYFKESKPVKGDKDLAYKWKDAEWHFASVANLEAFRKDPEKYAPQYGGYCAYGTAAGHKAPTEPDAWEIVDGKLYFNYNKDVQVKWRENQAEFIKQADQKWPEVKKQKE
jgi:YHS domain-containing protein